MNTQSTPIKKFKDFNIKPEYKAFPGKKIDVDQIINIELKIYDFKIEDSKKKAVTKFLTLDIELRGERRIVFTSAAILMQTIQQVPKEGFPFEATIIKQDQRLEFS